MLEKFYLIIIVVIPLALQSLYLQKMCKEILKTGLSCLCTLCHMRVIFSQGETGNNSCKS